MNTIFLGDAIEILKMLPDGCCQMCVTSPPYWGLRDYGVEGQLGLEETPEEYVSKMVGVFREARRVLRGDGVLWLNIGDSYAANRSYQVPSTKGGPKHSPAQGQSSNNKVPSGLKPKDLVGIPWLLAFALRSDGWYLRQDIIWHKSNPMPESVKDRCTKAHEYLFLMTKSQKYYWDGGAIEEPAKWERWGDQTENKKHPGTAGHLGGKKISELPVKNTRNRRSVWTIPTYPFPEAHFATFPPALIEPCILAGSRQGDVVLDPFIGSGTVGMVAVQLGRQYIGVELNPEYIDMANRRIANAKPK